MGRMKECYLNNLTEEELNEMLEEYYFHQEYLWEITGISTSQSKVDMDIHQTCLFDS